MAGTPRGTLIVLSQERDQLMPVEPVLHDGALNPATVYLQGLAASGERSMRSALGVIAGMAQPGVTHDQFPWHALRWEHVQVIRRRLLDRYAARTVNRMLSALRGVLRTCWRQGLISAEDYQRVTDLKSAASDRSKAGRALAPHEVELLLAGARSAAPGRPGLRNAAIVAAMVAGGLRRVEIGRLSRGDYAEARYRVRGKGGTIRTVPLAPAYVPVIDAWVDVLPSDPTAPLYPRFHKSGATERRALTADGVGRILDELRAALGTPFTPHDLRRTFATRLLDAGVDLATVKDLMGHANIQTTAIYDRRDETHMQEAVAKLERPTRFGEQ